MPVPMTQGSRSTSAFTAPFTVASTLTQIFFTSRFHDQLPPMGTSMPACRAQPKPPS
jgi:hypothetical protein